MVLHLIQRCWLLTTGGGFRVKVHRVKVKIEASPNQSTKILHVITATKLATSRSSVFFGRRRKKESKKGKKIIVTVCPLLH